MRKAASTLVAAAVFALGVEQGPGPARHFTAAVNLEESSETSANVSMGDLDGDGDLDLVLAKGRHWPLVDRVLLNDGRGTFLTTNLGPTPDHTHSALLADGAGAVPSTVVSAVLSRRDS